VGKLRVIEGGQGRASDPNEDDDTLGGATEISGMPFVDDVLGDVETVIRRELDAPMQMSTMQVPGVAAARISNVHFQPAPPAAYAAPRRRISGLAIAAGVVLAGGGYALGYVVATAERSPNAAIAPAPRPAAAIAPVEPARPPPPKPAPAPPPAVAATVPRAQPVAITLLEHRTLNALVSPIRGQVASVAKAGPIKAGDVVATVRGVSTSNPALARKVAELEQLAKQDPASYAPFLARTRRELERTQRIELASVKATAAGAFESRVKVGDRVEAKGTLGSLVDDTSWIAIATIPEASPTAAWSCVVSAADGSHTAACTIQTTEAVDGTGTRVTAEILAAGTEWLADADQHPQILVEPPGR
jgi:hypothetical protein